MASRSIIAAAVAASLVGISSANASLLSVSLMTNVGFDVSTVAPGTTAGVVPTTSWNNAFPNVLDSNNNLTNTGSNETVTDDGGNARTLSWSAGGGWFSTPEGNHPTADGNSELMNDAPADGTVTFTVSNLTDAAAHNVYVYVVGLEEGTPTAVNSLQIASGTTTYYGQFTPVDEWTTNSNSTDTFNGFTLIDGNSSPTNFEEGNYVEFAGVTGPSITVTLNGAQGQTGISGFQIESVSAPEPASLGLVSIGALSLLRRRRRIR